MFSGRSGTASPCRATTSMPRRRQRGDLVRVGGEQPDPSDAQQSARMSAAASYDRASAGKPSSRLASTVSRPAVLKCVRPQLGQQPDAASLVPAQIDHDPAAGVADLAERRLQLLAAVAASRTERVPGQALRVHPHQRRRSAARADLSQHQRDVLGAVRRRRSRASGTAVLGRQGGLHHALGAAWMDLRHAHIPVHVERGRQFTVRYSSLGVSRGQAVGHRGHAVVRVVSGIAIADLSAREQLL